MRLNIISTGAPGVHSGQEGVMIVRTGCTFGLPDFTTPVNAPEKDAANAELLKGTSAEMLYQDKDKEQNTQTNSSVCKVDHSDGLTCFPGSSIPCRFHVQREGGRTVP